MGADIKEIGMIQTHALLPVSLLGLYDFQRWPQCTAYAFAGQLEIRFVKLN